MSDLPKFTLEQVAAGIRAEVAKKPDKIYKKSGGSCLYVHGKKTPGCLIGVFALRNGVPLDYLLERNEGSAVSLRIWADDGAAHFADNVQVLQDQGNPWRDAFNLTLDDLPAEGVSRV